MGRIELELAWHVMHTRFHGSHVLRWEAAISSSSLNRLRRIIVILLLAGLPVGVAAVELKTEAAHGFEKYVALAESTMADQLKPGGAFLWADGLPEPQRGDTYARLQRGEIVSANVQTKDFSERSETPGALIHHWVGMVFIPGATLAQVLRVVQDYDRQAERYKPEVILSKTLEHHGSDFKIYFRLKKKKVITVVLDTYYDVHQHPVDATHAYSDSHSTRVSEVQHAGQPDEHDLPPGKDGGFMWRLNSYWRYFDNGHGVYVQCEAISLTRDIPEGLGWLVKPFIEKVPKESLEFTMASTRAAVLKEYTRASR